MQELDYDVIVAGGGSAGSMAALAAARAGARACLIEGQGYAGGTCLALGNALPFHNSRGEAVIGGHPQEFVDRMIAAGGASERGHLPNTAGIGGSFTPLDPDIMKYVLFEMLTEAGVDMWLHTRLLGGLTEDGGVTGVQVHNKSGMRELRARVVIDATGDADVAVGAGADFHQDVPDEALNATLLFRVAGVECDRFLADIHEHPGHMTMLADPYLREVKGLTPRIVMDEHVKTIHDMPYIYLANVVRDYIPEKDWPEWGITSDEKSGWGRIRPFASRLSIMAAPRRDDLVTINATSMTFDATNGTDLSRAEIQGQRQVQTLITLLRRYIPGFENAYLHSVTPSVSVRASRRIVGEYQITREDAELGRRFPDGVARCSYPMSVQATDRPNIREHLFVRNGGDYDIPYRCFVPREVDGLLVAGRCLSATREASGSARIGASCMSYGQATGTAAALAALQGIQPRNVDYEELRLILRQNKAVI